MLLHLVNQRLAVILAEYIQLGIKEYSKFIYGLPLQSSLPQELGELYWVRCGGVHKYKCYRAPERQPQKVVLCSSPLSGQIKEQFKKQWQQDEP